MPLFLVILRPARLRPKFYSGYIAGITFFAGSCPWVYTTLYRYAELGTAVSALAFVLFLALMGFFWALFAALAGWLSSAWPRWSPLILPACWTAVELLRTHLPFGGFPWNLLGASQVNHSGFMLVLPFGGVYCASFLVALSNALIAALIYGSYQAFRFTQKSAQSASAMSYRGMLFAEAAILFLLAGFATFPYHPAPLRPPKLDSCLVQPVTSFNTPWSAAGYNSFLVRMRQLTLACHARPGAPSLVLWPEQPAPLEYQLQPQLQAQLAALAVGLHAELVLEEVGYSRDSAGQPRLDQPHNSALQILPNGLPGQRYDKIHLVPFGEDLPLPAWLLRIPILARWTRQAGNFVPGRQLTLFSLAHNRFGVLICFESDFPQLARRMTLAGANWLVNLSDDGWYGNSSAARQSLVGARLRAMENRRWMLRATNDGITAVIDPLGRVVARLPRWRAQVLQAGFSPRHELTFYTRHGDWPAEGCAIIVLIFVVFSLPVRRFRQARLRRKSRPAASGE